MMEEAKRFHCHSCLFLADNGIGEGRLNELIQIGQERGIEVLK